jgi:hypothetical protein
MLQSFIIHIYIIILILINFFIIIIKNSVLIRALILYLSDQFLKLNSLLLRTLLPVLESCIIVNNPLVYMNIYQLSSVVCQ